MEWASSGSAAEARLLGVCDARVFLFSLKSERDFSRADSAVIAQIARYKHQSHVNAVAVPKREGITTEMVTMDATKVSLWDLEVSKQPLLSLPVGHGSAVTYSGMGERCILASTGESELVHLDTRDRKRGRCNEWAHTWPGLFGCAQIAVSPFVPHWAAVAAQRGILLYDLRFGEKGPVQELLMHSNALTSVSWSPRHSELLASSSLDGSVRLWDLTAPPLHCVSTTVLDDLLPMTGVEFQRAGDGYGERLLFGSLSGVLGSAEVVDGFLASILHSRCPEPMARAGRRVERLLYTRNLKDGLEAAISTAKTYQAKCPKDALQLLSACTPAEFLTHDPESAASPQELFEAETKHYSYLLPPGYPLPEDMPPALLQSYLATRQELQYRCLIEDRDHAELASKARTIVRQLSKSVDALDVATVRDIVALLLEHNFPQAMPFVENVAAVYEQRKELKRFISITAGLLSPTIYDMQGGKQADGLHDALSSCKACLAQLELYGRILQRNDLVHRVMLAAPVTCVSSECQMLRLEELLEHNFFAEVLLTATKLVLKTKGLPFSVTLVKFISEEVEKKLASQLIALCTSKPQGTEAAGEALKRHTGGIALIGQFKTEKMSQCVPQRVNVLITQGLGALSKSIPAAFARLEEESTDEPYLQKARQKAAKRLAKEMDAYSPETVQGSFKELFLGLVREVQRYLPRKKPSKRTAGETGASPREERPKSPRKSKRKSPRDHGNMSPSQETKRSPQAQQSTDSLLP